MSEKTPEQRAAAIYDKWGVKYPQDFILREIAAEFREARAEIANLKKDNADLVKAIDGAIKDREYYDKALKEAEAKIKRLIEARRLYI